MPDALERTVKVEEVPSARHRVMCIEGSVSREHVRDMIAYCARRGFNAYFTQFRRAYTFYDRWYGFERYRGKGGPKLDPAEAVRLCEAAKREALKRGMALHVVGHGWTCEPFGIPGDEWAPYKGRVPAEAKGYFAETGGKRQLWHGIPLNTNLCYSNAKVRTVMASAVAEYAAEHPEGEVIHVWLADGSNNNCECKACRKARPSDFYVEILNEINEWLERRGLSTRIVFLAYVDLLWAPRKHRIKNPDRFILMFAPISRSYERAFLEAGSPEETVGPYRRNKLRFPRSPGANLEMLEGWRRMFDGDCVDFDYHLMWAHHFDPGQMQLARVVHKDVRDLRKLGMDGFISCQIQRVAFPTGLWLHLIGKTLWDARTPWRLTVEEYFADVFGEGGTQVKRYLEGLSRLVDAPALRSERGEAARANAVHGLRKVAAHVEAFLPTIEAGCATEDATTASAWKLLREHAWYVRAFADIWEGICSRDPSTTERFTQFERELNRRLPRVHHVFDTWLARDLMKLNMREAGIELA